ncbi:MAG: hypothetical protein ABI151_08065 [Chitinophagaceae bacterium]
MITSKTNLLFILLFVPCWMEAQYNQVNFYPPEAAALMRQVDYPVSYLTGTPDISIPIHSVKAGSLTIPVGLSFHLDSYIKANQMPGSVGAGWSLSTELQVTRTINGADDLDHGGYCYNNKIPNNYVNDYISRTRQEKKLMIDGLADEEPDKFFYSLLGKAGSFYFQKQADGSFEPVCVPYTGVKVKYDFTNRQFIIIDTDGSSYLFSTTKVDRVSEINGTRSLIMAWKCESVKNSFGLIEINFTYGAYYDEERYSYSDRVEVYDNQNDRQQTHSDYRLKPNYNGFSKPPDFPFWQITGPKFLRFAGQYSSMSAYEKMSESFQDVGNYPTGGEPSRTIKESRTYLLTQISFRGGYIDFFYINQHQLASLQIKNSDGAVIRTANFSQSHEGDPGGTPHTIAKYSHSRKLDWLKINDDKYRFDYGFDRQYGNVNDFWGYEASSPGNYCVVPYQSIDVSLGNCKMYYDQQPVDITASFAKKALIGEGRDPAAIFNLSNTQRTALTVTYPTGGKTEYIVGQNRFRDPVHSDMVLGVGGYRIEKIRSYDGVHPEATNQKVFRYGPNEDGTGIIRAQPSFDPVYGNSFLEEVNTYALPDQVAGIGVLVLNSTRKRTYLSGSSRSLTFDNGSIVYYNEVAVYNSGPGLSTGKTIYTYDLPSYTQSFTSPTDPFPFERNDWDLASPQSTTHFKYKEGGYHWISKKESHYNKYLFPYRIFQGRASLRGNMIIVDGLNTTTASQDYFTENYGNLEYKHNNIEVGTMQLDWEEEKIRDDNNIVLTKRVDYSYSKSDPTLVSRMQTTGSDGLVTIQDMTYPKDYASGTMVNDLVSANIISVPIEKVTRKQGKILSADAFQYNSSGTLSTVYKLASRPFPESNFKMSNRSIVGDFSTTSGNGEFMLDAKYLLPKTTLTWDQYLNLEEISPREERKTGYIWGYDHLYPIAEAINADAKDIFYTSFEEGNGNSDESKTGSKSKSDGLDITLSDFTVGEYLLSFWRKNGPDWIFETSIINVNSERFSLHIGGHIDEVRFYPRYAQMKTYTYDRLVGMTSSSDEKGVVTYFDYDAFKRLRLVRDQDRNILKKFEYKYANREVFTKPALQGLLDDFQQLRPGGLRAFFDVPFNYSPSDTNKFIHDTRLIYRDGLAQLPAQYQSIPFASSGWYTAFNLQLANPYDPVYHDAQQFNFMQSGYAVEWRLKMPRSPANGHIVGVGSYFNFNVFFSRLADGYYLTGFSDFDGHLYGSDNVANFPPDNQFSEIAVGGVDLFDDFTTIKLQVTPTRYYVYVNGQLKFDVARDNNGPNGGPKPIDTHFYVDALFFGNAGAVDYVKVFDNDGVLQFDEDFSTPINPKRPDPQLVFPTPVNCMSAFVHFFNLKNGSGYTESEIIQIYDSAGQTLNPCN